MSQMGEHPSGGTFGSLGSHGVAKRNSVEDWNTDEAEGC